jgi:hypothetical protein
VGAIASDGRWAVAVANPRLHTIAALLDDTGTLVLLIWLFPLIILAVGAPVALLVRALYEIVKRL